MVDERVRTRSKNDSGERVRELRGLSPGRQTSFWGRLDDKYTTIPKGTAARIEAARRVVIPEAGHTLHAEGPAPFLEVLQQFPTDTAE